MAPLLGFGLPVILAVVGIALVIMEALAPGAHLIVVGVALLGAGLAGMLLGPLASPLALAVMVLLFGAGALFVYREFDFYGGKGEARTSDSDSLQGNVGRVVDRVTETGGRIKLESGGFNPYYEARSVEGEVPEGTEAIVVNPGGGNVLTVESVEEVGVDEIDRELARESDAAGSEDEPGNDETAAAERTDREQARES